MNSRRLVLYAFLPCGIGMSLILGYFFCIPLGLLLTGLFNLLDGKSFFAYSPACHLSDSKAMWLGCAGLGMGCVAVGVVFFIPWVTMAILMKSRSGRGEIE